MTVTVTDAFSGPFTPNGVATVFGFDFKAASADEVSVVIVGTDLILSRGLFTVALSATGEGGTVSFTLPPAAGAPDFLIFSDPGFQQQGTFTGGERPFTPGAINRLLDEGAVRDIALREGIRRSIQVPIGEAAPSLPPAAVRAGSFLAFDADGNPVPASGTGADAGLRVDLASEAGSQEVGHRRVGTPAILSVAKLLDALGVIPQQFGWDGLPASDATAYVQMAVDHCNDGTQAATTAEAVNAAFAKALVIPCPTRITEPLVISNRAVDRTNGRFEINGAGGSGVIVQDGDFTLIDTSTPDPALDGDGEMSPGTEYLFVRDMRFMNRNRYNTGTTISEKFLRVAFDGCEWWQMPCMIGTRYAQEWFFTNIVCRGLPTGRPFFQSYGSYAIRALLAKFQFSWENAAGAFLLRHPTANKAVDSCSFDYCSFETHGGPFLAAGQVEGSGVSRLYAENAEGPVIDLRCIDNGSRNDGFRLDNSKLQANATNIANSAFGNVLVGPGGLLGTGNSSRGGLYDNAASVVAEGGLNLRKGHAFGELESSGDRMKTANKIFQIDVDAQIDLVPDPLSAYNVKIIASTVIVYPINGTQNHTVSLPPPLKGLQVRVINRLTAPTQDFEVRPSYSADGSKFRGGATNAGLVQDPGASKVYLCLEDGIWDVAT